ncbi:amino acid transporter [Undibacterium sp. CY18W]|uniref:Amino acid transporter n=1 Tax=Undibacterium hunanense TaxID=2762292 RepID=A0ABR6ZQM4_9BURK|nr:LysE/ArgO family amino acid transporter [Undibacterium hunanense]MBC3918187.1 amino acid transporter [Undibacterium hunanense]
MLTFILKGMGMSAGLIMAIGSQNAHVLRMGLRRQHVGLTVVICIACEILLILAGVAGVGGAINSQPFLLALARWGGAAFLLWYGLRSLRAAFQQQSLVTTAGDLNLTAGKAVLAVLGATLLNPHTYLDTVVLLGAIGGQQPGDGKYWFALGAVLNATIWFAALGFGARLLAPLFARPVAWRVMDTLIGVVMLLLAANLALA